MPITDEPVAQAGRVTVAAPDAPGARTSVTSPARPPSIGGSRALAALFTATVFSCAGLLFVVQPLFSRLALPLLGGAPAVWNACMLVFQALLLGGYLHAHLLGRWLPPSRQVALHVGLLALSLVLLPIGISYGSEPPAIGSPIPWLVRAVLTGLGFPFLLLAATAPLLQQWFARTDHPHAGDPYFLYAASNAGSLLALLAYPFLVEPLLGLGEQRLAWSAGYSLAAALLTACGFVALRRGAPAVAAQWSDGARTGAVAVGGTGDAAHLEGRWSMRLWWTLLALAPSSLLLGVTGYLTTDLAVVPLLWVIPLALYLLTFVLTFARRPIIPHWLALRAQPLVLLPVVVTLFTGRSGDARVMLPVHLSLFFLTALVCHGELARLRPPAARLTDFYLCLSIGGMLGGAFNVLAAPLLFDRVLEYPIMLALACALRPWPRWRPAGSASWRDARPVLHDLLLPLALGGALYLVLTWGGPWHPLAAIYVVPALGATAAIVCVLFIRRPLRLALGILATLAAGILGHADGRRPMLTARSFFGSYSVRDLGDGYRALYHGTTLHGAQRLTQGEDRVPRSYYGLRGPLGDIVGAARLRGRPLRIGVVGLGTGTVACYTRVGDGITFHEIDPLVVTLARDSGLFTYLARCAPDARIVLGDARLTLARDSAAVYDVLVLDAFSSDAIPVHLLTREAMSLYLARLAPGGVLALHVSNRYLDLRPAVAALASDAGAVAFLGEQRGLPPDDAAQMYSPSRWVAVSRDRSVLEPLAIRDRWREMHPLPGTRVWSDDYANVLGALTW